MFTTFALLATILNPATGLDDTYVLDYGMTQEDCAYVLGDVVESNGVELEPGRVVPASSLSLTCEAEG